MLFLKHPNGPSLRSHSHSASEFSWAVESKTGIPELPFTEFGVQASSFGSAGGVFSGSQTVSLLHRVWSAGQLIWICWWCFQWFADCFPAAQTEFGVQASSFGSAGGVFSGSQTVSLLHRVRSAGQLIWICWWCFQWFSDCFPAAQTEFGVQASSFGSAGGVFSGSQTVSLLHRVRSAGQLIWICWWCFQWFSDCFPAAQTEFGVQASSFGSAGGVFSGSQTVSLLHRQSSECRPAHLDLLVTEFGVQASSFGSAGGVFSGSQTVSLLHRVWSAGQLIWICWWCFQWFADCFPAAQTEFGVQASSFGSAGGVFSGSQTVSLLHRVWSAGQLIWICWWCFQWFADCFPAAQTEFGVQASSFGSAGGVFSGSQTVSLLHRVWSAGQLIWICWWCFQWFADCFPAAQTEFGVQASSFGSAGGVFSGSQTVSLLHRVWSAGQLIWICWWCFQWFADCFPAAQTEFGVQASSFGSAGGVFSEFGVQASSFGSAGGVFSGSQTVSLLHRVWSAGQLIWICWWCFQWFADCFPAAQTEFGVQASSFGSAGGVFSGFQTVSLLHRVRSAGQLNWICWWCFQWFADCFPAAQTEFGVQASSFGSAGGVFSGFQTVSLLHRCAANGNIPKEHICFHKTLITHYTEFGVQASSFGSAGGVFSGFQTVSLLHRCGANGNIWICWWCFQWFSDCFPAAQTEFGVQASSFGSAGGVFSGFQTVSLLHRVRSAGQLIWICWWCFQWFSDCFPAAQTEFGVQASSFGSAGGVFSGSQTVSLLHRQSLECRPAHLDLLVVFSVVFRLFPCCTGVVPMETFGSAGGVFSGFQTVSLLHRVRSAGQLIWICWWCFQWFSDCFPAAQTECGVQASSFGSAGGVFSGFQTVSLLHRVRSAGQLIWICWWCFQWFADCFPAAQTECGVQASSFGSAGGVFSGSQTVSLLHRCAAQTEFGVQASSFGSAGGVFSGFQTVSLLHRVRSAGQLIWICWWCFQWFSDCFPAAQTEFGVQASSFGSAGGVFSGSQTVSLLHRVRSAGQLIWICWWCFQWFSDCFPAAQTEFGVQASSFGSAGGVFSGSQTVSLLHRVWSAGQLIWICWWCFQWFSDCFPAAQWFSDCFPAAQTEFGVQASSFGSAGGVFSGFQTVSLLHRVRSAGQLIWICWWCFQWFSDCFPAAQTEFGVQASSFGSAGGVFSGSQTVSLLHRVRSAGQLIWICWWCFQWFSDCFPAAQTEFGVQASSFGSAGGVFSGFQTVSLLHRVRSAGQLIWICWWCFQWFADCFPAAQTEFGVQASSFGSAGGVFSGSQTVSLLHRVRSAGQLIWICWWCFQWFADCFPAAQTEFGVQASSFGSAGGVFSGSQTVSLLHRVWSAGQLIWICWWCFQWFSDCFPAAQWFSDCFPAAQTEFGVQASSFGSAGGVFSGFQTVSLLHRQSCGVQASSFGSAGGVFSGFQTVSLLHRVRSAGQLIWICWWCFQWFADCFPAAQTEFGVQASSFGSAGGVFSGSQTVSLLHRVRSAGQLIWICWWCFQWFADCFPAAQTEFGVQASSFGSAGGVFSGSQTVSLLHRVRSAGQLIWICWWCFQWFSDCFPAAQTEFGVQASSFGSAGGVFSGSQTVSLLHRVRSAGQLIWICWWCFQWFADCFPAAQTEFGVQASSFGSAGGVFSGFQTVSLLHRVRSAGQLIWICWWCFQWFSDCFPAAQTEVGVQASSFGSAGGVFSGFQTVSLLHRVRSAGQPIWICWWCFQWFSDCFPAAQTEFGVQASSFGSAGGVFSGFQTVSLLHRQSAECRPAQLDLLVVFSVTEFGVQASSFGSAGGVFSEFGLQASSFGSAGGVFSGSQSLFPLGFHYTES
ncbi:hypothetical protein BDR26DRAFT_901620 [Obelidium mucronatum]|nr:hypothetical protein BDR26DRAFT_901620 [Obelidium mucronatum]